MTMSLTATTLGSALAFLISDAILREYLETAFPERIAYLKDRVKYCMQLSLNPYPKTGLDYENTV